MTRERPETAGLLRDSVRETVRNEPGLKGNDLGRPMRPEVVPLFHPGSLRAVSPTLSRSNPAVSGRSRVIAVNSVSHAIPRRGIGNGMFSAGAWNQRRSMTEKSLPPITPPVLRGLLDHR